MMQHHMTNTRIYRIWNSILNRCKNKKTDSYKFYGGKGITVCNEWKSFVNFRDWALANGYNDTLSIDRIDSKGNYEPSNCRWVTMREQQNNRCNNVRLTYNGETHTIMEWSRITGIKPKIYYDRYYRGWDIKRLFEQPVGNQGRKIGNKQ